MKRFCTGLITGLFLFLLDTALYAQKAADTRKTIAIEPYPLTITFNKTTNLIFPSAIKSVDRGSRDVLAQKAKGISNILLVKAGREDFLETNLSVVTVDGTLYSFLLTYSNNPLVMNLSFLSDTASSSSALTGLPYRREVKLQTTAEKVAGKKRVMYGVKTSKDKMRFRLNGLYITGDTFYLQLEVQNRSYIRYDVDLLRFFIEDERSVKRTATQKIELQPLYVLGDTTEVKEQSKNVLTVALSKFTLFDGKNLRIQLLEKGGGRNLSLKVRNRILLNAIPADDN